MKFSVSKSITTSLVAFEDVLFPYTNMNAWLDKTGEKPKDM